MRRFYQITGPDYFSFQMRKDLCLLCKASVNGRVRRKQTATQLLAERLGNMPKQLVSGSSRAHMPELCIQPLWLDAWGLQQKVGCCFPLDKNTLKSLSGVLCAQPEAWRGTCRCLFRALHKHESCISRQLSQMTDFPWIIQGTSLLEPGMVWRQLLQAQVSPAEMKMSFCCRKNFMRKKQSVTAIPQHPQDHRYEWKLLLLVGSWKNSKGIQILASQARNTVRPQTEY